LGDIPVLGSVAYSKSVQEADLQRTPVMQAGAAVVRELDEARHQLMELVGSVEVCRSHEESAWSQINAAAIEPRRK
jgi:hypothetical protein